MPVNVLSSFISYRPKRKTKPTPPKVSSPFPIKGYNIATTSPGHHHPYASSSSSPRIIDIHDDHQSQSQSQYYGGSTTGTPQVKLDVDVELHPEPLADWFPSGFLRSDPFTMNLDGETAGASGSGSGSGVYHGNGSGRDLAKMKMNGIGTGNGSGDVQVGREQRGSLESEDEEDEDVETLSSAEDVLAGLEAMDASTFVIGPDPQTDTPPSTWKKSAPTPIKIPNAAQHGPKVQLVRSTPVSRPTSQVSSPESSAISGTTLARALIANTFVLSGSDVRSSRHRMSSLSTLTRTDSATLPRSEFMLIHSPYWRDTMNSVEIMSLSPTSAPPAIPPVPENAEKVYVPPQTIREKPSSPPSAGKSTTPERGGPNVDSSFVDQENARAARRMSRITEASTSTQSFPPPSAVESTKPSFDEPMPARSSSPSSSTSRGNNGNGNGKSRRYSIRPDSDTPAVIAESTSPSVSDTPSSPKDLDNVLDYYSFADTPEPVERNFRLPFSPITEESSSQLSPPTPFGRPDSRASSKRSVPPAGRFFLGTTTTPSPSGLNVRVDFTRRGSESRNRDSISKALLPIGERPMSSQLSPIPGPSSITTRLTNTPPTTHTTPPPPSLSFLSSLPTLSTSHSTHSTHSSSSDTTLLLPPPVSTIFNRARSGSAPSPIKVVRDSHDLTSYNITVTPRRDRGDDDDGADSTPTTGDSVEMGIVRQEFPETPSAFSPAFSPGVGVVGGGGGYGGFGSGADGSGSGFEGRVGAPPSPAPQTPMSAFLPSGGIIQPSLAQQVMLTRAATSVHGARHSRQASLGRVGMGRVGYVGVGVGSGSGRPSSVGVGVGGGGTMKGDAGGVGVEVGDGKKEGGEGEAGDGKEARERVEDAVGGVGKSAVGEDAKEVEEHSLSEAEAFQDPSSQLDTTSPLPPPPPPKDHPAPAPAPTTATQAPAPATQPALTTTTTTTTTTTQPEVQPAAGESPSAQSFSSHSEGSTLAYGGIASTAHSHSQPSSRAPSRAGSKRSSGSHLAQTVAAVGVALTVAAASTSVIAESTQRTQQQHRIPPVPTMAPPPPPPPPPPPLLETVSSSSGNNNAASSSSGSAFVPIPTPRIDASALRTPEPGPSHPRANRPPFMISPPLPQAHIPPAQLSASSLYSYDAGPSAPPLGSPPPYYTVVNHHHPGDAGTPSTSGSYDPNYRFGQPYQSQSPPPHHAGEFGGNTAENSGQAIGQGGHPSTGRRHHRFRPPLPAGPRRPSQQHGASASSVTAAMRDRGGSVSSVASNAAMPSGGRRQQQQQNQHQTTTTTPLPSPKFAEPAPKFRGYTMDAAKWTFTSTQLQAIVSRAIRQSFQPSSIRLLRLETLDEDIPDELERLEARRTDTKMRYRNLARRRAGMLEALAGCVVVDGAGMGIGMDQEGVLRLVEELKEVSGAMDRLTEELHSLDEQVAQVNQVCQVHSASALAMALRKLNKSFLNKWAEAQSLRGRVETLEAERDEAWKQAEDIASEYDELRTRMVGVETAAYPEEGGQNRYNRVTAVRQSSLRASRAGLRSGGHLSSSHRASTGSSGRGALNPPSSARTTFIPEDIPPVPPIPRRRPVDIMTNLPVRHSLGVPTSGTTPTSETRAMVRAQEELYEMLGISVNENRSRRSRSVIGLPGEAEPQPGSPSLSYYDPPLTTGRRASLPGSAAPDAYNAFTADVNLILTSDRSGWI